ncbi:THO complex subunit 1 transcription elongation factor-domain-containing protein [Suillus ampliporus]|nr:THO complex subunit 1 transcription elongation factor-domain-containing protein [Suillus ampliporus]
MSSQVQSVQSLLKSFPQRPFDQKVLHGLVGNEVQKFQGKSSPENVKSQWEFLLKNEVFTLAATEGSASKCDSTSYYDGLRDRLDLVLTFTEHDVCEATFPFTVLQDLLETQTITSCSQIFSWIESSAARLTKEMVPQKGKALILLRTLNDLLRRLSKMGSTTIFCGRILTFLSGVFPLGERSGVNLRGEYGPMWEGVKDMEKRDEDVTMEAAKGPEDSQKMEVDGGKKESADTKDKDGFYTTFWSLQLPFSRPPLFAIPNTFGEFKDAVDKVLPVIKEATTKERAMMGNRGASGASSGLKRKREPELGEASNNSEYFFAKFLTSPELLTLEIADTHFRRQVLFQLLILLHHLLSFTKAAKGVWSTPRNRSLQMDFTLEPADTQWVHDTIAKASAELRSTAPNGPTFADTVNVILDREKNWVRWKNDLCAPFDREPWSAEVGSRKVGMEEATREARSKRQEDPEPWKWNLGSESLTEIWEMGYRDLSDLQNPFQPGDVKDFVKKVKQEDARIEMRRKQLMKTAERLAQARAKAAAAAASQESTAPQDVPAAAPTLAPAAETPKAEPPAVSFSPLFSMPSASSSPLHPSLPPKPGSSPIKSFTEAGASSPARPPITPAPPSSTIAAPTPTPTPAAASATETSPAAVPSPAPPLTDDQIARYEENRQRWSWLALRTARDQYLQHFGKIGTGDVILLANEIELEKERDRNQKTQKAEEMRVLVTGGAGYIGSHVVYALQQTRRYKVISVDNHHNSFPASLTRVAQIARDALPENPSEADKESAEIDAFQCDLTNPEQIKGIFERYGKGGIWGVVHIAQVGESVEIPLTYYANNVAATVSLLQTMSDFDCTRIVYSSSATVYGTPPVIPIPETTRLKADSPYGKTKVMSEMVIDDLCHAEPNRWRAISLRYFNPAGAHPSGLIGEDPRGRPGNLLPLLAHMAIGRVDDATLKVFGNDYPTPDGTCVRDYLHVLDLASGHLLALDALASESAIFDNCLDDARYKAYNLGKGKGMSVLQIVEAMRKATGFDFKYEVIGRRRGDVPDLTADPALAERELGFKAPQTLEVMCRDLWNWQTMNPQGYTRQ